MGFIFKIEQKVWRGILWGLLVKNPFLTCLRLGDPRKRLWSPSTFLRVNTVMAHCFVGDDARCCAARSSLDTLALRRRLRHSVLLSILHDFYFSSIASGRASPFESTVFSFSLHNCYLFFLNSFGFRTEIVVFVVFASSSLRAQLGDTQELFFPVFNTEDLFVKQSSHCKSEISLRHELSKGFRGHRHSKAKPNSVQGFPRQRQINRHSFL
jgi:hypothetical protein